MNNKFCNSMVLRECLFSMGAHIGHLLFEVCDSLSYYFLGVRSFFVVFDLYKTISSIKNALIFFERLIYNFGHSLFCYSGIYKLNIHIKLFLIQLTKERNQSFSYLKWSPGCITNYQSVFLRLIAYLFRDSMHVWYKKSSGNPHRGLLKYSFYDRFFVQRLFSFFSNKYDINSSFRSFFFRYRNVLLSDRSRISVFSFLNSRNNSNSFIKPNLRLRKFQFKPYSLKWLPRWRRRKLLIAKRKKVRIIKYRSKVHFLTRLIQFFFSDKPNYFKYTGTDTHFFFKKKASPSPISIHKSSINTYHIYRNSLYRFFNKLARSNFFLFDFNAFFYHYRKKAFLTNTFSKLGKLVVSEQHLSFYSSFLYYTRFFIRYLYDSRTIKNNFNIFNKGTLFSFFKLHTYKKSKKKKHIWHDKSFYFRSYIFHKSSIRYKLKSKYKNKHKYKKKLKHKGRHKLKHKHIYRRIYINKIKSKLKWNLKLHFKREFRKLRFKNASTRSLVFGHKRPTIHFIKIFKSKRRWNIKLNRSNFFWLKKNMMSTRTRSNKTKMKYPHLFKYYRNKFFFYKSKHGRIHNLRYKLNYTFFFFLSFHLHNFKYLHLNLTRGFKFFFFFSPFFLNNRLFFFVFSFFKRYFFLWKNSFSFFNSLTFFSYKIIHYKLRKFRNVYFYLLYFKKSYINYRYNLYKEKHSKIYSKKSVYYRNRNKIKKKMNIKHSKKKKSKIDFFFLIYIRLIKWFVFFYIYCFFCDSFFYFLNKKITLDIKKNRMSKQKKALIYNSFKSQFFYMDLLKILFSQRWWLLYIFFLRKHKYLFSFLESIYNNDSEETPEGDMRNPFFRHYLERFNYFKEQREKSKEISKRNLNINHKKYHYYSNRYFRFRYNQILHSCRAHKNKNSSMNRNSFARFSVFKVLPSFISFLLRIFYVTKSKFDEFLDGANSASKILNEDIYFNSVYRRFLLFWRSIIFFKCFKKTVNLPDCLVFINPENQSAPFNDFSGVNIPVISVADSNSDHNRITYLIASNDDSLILFLFYFLLFSNASQYSISDRYSNFYY